MKHTALTEKARRAISDLFSDRSVTPEQTAESLAELRDEINVMIEAIESDRQWNPDST